MIQLEFRGLHQFSYRQFLEELGGMEITESDRTCKKTATVIKGADWEAALSLEDTLSFSKTVKIPRTFITFTGDPEVVQEIIAKFRLKALRGGG